MIRNIKFLTAIAIASAALPASAVVTILDGQQSITVTRGFYTPPIRLRLTDDQGHPATGRSVPVPVSIGTPATFPPSACCSDADGILTIPPALAPKIGTFTVTYSSDQLGSTTQTVKVVPYGPLLEIAVLQGDGQRAMQQATFGGIKVRATRAGVPSANRELTCSSTYGPAIFPAQMKVVTDSNGEALTAGFTAIKGYGAGDFSCGAVDEIEGVGVQASAKFYVTYPDGRTWSPLSALWFDPLHSGWGLSVPQHQDRVFPVVFTYRKGAPFWYVLDGTWSQGFGVGYTGDFVEYRGAPYFAFDTTRVAGSRSYYGSYSFPQLKLDQAVLQTTCPPGYIGFSSDCQAGGAVVAPFKFSPAAPQAEHGVSDIWWGGPSQAGWGISIAEDHGNLFLAWFTYDADGKPTWFSMSEGQWSDASTWTGPVFRTSGEGLFAGDYSGRGLPYTATKVGDFTIRFSGTTAATFTYNVDGHAGTLNLQRFDY